jgi:hypothetical protein
MGKSMVSGVDFPQQTNPLTCGANPIPQPFRAPSRKHGFVGMKNPPILGWVQSHGGNPNSSKSWSSDDHDHDLVLKPMVTTGDPCLCHGRTSDRAVKKPLMTLRVELNVTLII